MLVTTKHMKNQFDVVILHVNMLNVQHVYHLKLNKNYFLMKMIKNLNYNQDHNNPIHMVQIMDIINSHMVMFVLHLIHINRMDRHQLNKITILLPLSQDLIMLYNHGQIKVLLAVQMNKMFNI